MPTELVNVLKQTKCSIDDIVQAVETDGDLSDLKLTQKASKKLISILKDELDMRNEEPKVLMVLGSIVPNANLINQIVGSGPELSSICDKLLSTSISSKRANDLDQKSLSIIFGLINRSDKLKSQLCMSIQEYILTSIDHKTIDSQLLPTAMEILVCAVTHHQENRTFFIKNTPKEKISAVFDLSKSTGNIMVQIFCAEFLWRVAIPMRMSQDEKAKIFGKYANSLYSITASSFRQGIFNFINEINEDRQDINRIIQIPIKNVIIGNCSIDGKHNLYLGIDSIVLCVSHTNILSEFGSNSELITLKKEDIAGIGNTDNDFWCIGIDENFDTLPELFEDLYKIIFFKSKSIANLKIAQQRFGQITAPPVPMTKSLLHSSTKAETPKPKADIKPMKEISLKKKTQTPKSAQIHTKPKEKVAPKKKRIETPSRNTVKFLEQPQQSKKPNTTPKQYETSSDDSDIEEDVSAINNDDNFERKQLMNATQNTKTNFEDVQPIEQTNSHQIEQDHKSDEMQIENRNTDDFIPPVKISGSYMNNSEDTFDSTSGSESPQPQSTKSDIDHHQISVEPISTPFDKENEPFSTKPITYKAKRREYTPERWELETFDELKNFSQAIRSRLSERHLMLNRAIDDTVSQSLKDISDFMSKCDEDMMQLRNDFDESSTQIAQDIEQKQKMVAELGDQQSEHIIQMLHDCGLLQKRAEELVKRFSQQKKTLLANQEKHIALFREDMRSEVKAAVTTKKRESSKKLVQKLVNLLDEL